MLRIQYHEHLLLYNYYIYSKTREIYSDNNNNKFLRFGVPMIIV